MNKTVRFILLFLAAMLIGFFFVSVVSADIGGPPVETPAPIVTPVPVTPEPTIVITPEPTVVPTAEPTAIPTAFPTPDLVDLHNHLVELVDKNSVLIEANTQLLNSLVVLGTIFSLALLILTIFTYSIFRMVRSLLGMFDWW